MSNISHGSVATRLRCGGSFSDDNAEYDGEKVLKIGQNLTKCVVVVSRIIHVTYNTPRYAEFTTGSM